MTAAKGPAAAAPSRRRPAVLPTILVALACFGVTFEFLAFQLNSGHDPALGNASTASGPAKVRPKRKIIITKVIPSAGAGGTSQSTSSSGTQLSASPAPVTSSTS